ncbi:phosphoglycerate mutase family protein [Siccirubricoccus sp. KC 17139]|uniref:Phosphoglycerate mutase family protein n=1 Tax=Siccirubricoccus soli TaxID=2899147 RepID=A0ABT1D5L9_9PROT|nr:histidine phosphatase family protein [Siccirubricoccus soli]MCO6417222.1 phosphoglycerate mutase family protein [Siccirubricoccus soli]MCP2683357.1 phosphoglycerate mutase family protein [Siccirubricoccus soli]
MRPVHFITHPEVVIDPAVPVTDWPLSARGIARMQRLASRPWARGLGAIFCSAERKARDAAGLLAAPLGLAPIILPGLGENDRSATGYLPRTEFETVADAFFAQPMQSVRGWERAADAQRRILAAVEAVLAQVAGGTGAVAILAHGAVGALLLCHLKRVPISRAEDQPGEGGGQAFSFEAASRALLAGWRSLEALGEEGVPAG